MVANKSSDKSFQWLIGILCGLLILAHFISSFFPQARLWGINHLAYFPLWVRIVFTLIGLSVLLPWVNEKIDFYLRKFLDYLQSSFSQKKYLWYLIFSFASMGIFYLLRDQTHFLGDGAQTISLLEKGKLHLKWTEPLEILIHLYAYRFLNLFLKVNAGTLYSLMSIISGGIFVFLLFLFSELLGKNKEEGFLVFLLLGFMGSVQLFFGYAEHYTLLYLALLSYLYFSLRFLQRSGGFLPVVLFFFLAIFSHFSAFYLFPSFLFLLWIGFEFKNKKTKTNFRWLVSILSLMLFSGFLFFYLKNRWMLGQLTVPLYPGYYYAPDYTLFSWSHLLDMLSLQLLLSPVGFVLILAILLNRDKKIKGFFSFKDKLVFFLIMVALFQLGYNFLLNPGLGMARDWDLFSTTALGYTLLGIYILPQWAKEKKSYRYASTVLVFTSFLSIFPWILINHNPQLSIKRFRDLLELDSKKSRSGHYVLEQYFLKEDMKEEKEKESKNFWEKFPELDLTERGLKNYREGKNQQAIQYFQSAIQLEPYLAEAHCFLGLAYYTAGKIPEAETEYKKAIKLRPDFAKSYVYLGHLYTFKNQVEEAIKVYDKAVRLKTEEPAAYYNLAYLYLLKNKLKKAETYARGSIALNPNSHLFHFNLGFILLKSGKLEESEKELLKSIELKQDYYFSHYHLSQVYAKKGDKEKAEEENRLYLKYKSEAQVSPDTSALNIIDSDPR
jgi:tetratricopeptide (TPR) repeat protein